MEPMGQNLGGAGRTIETLEASAGRTLGSVMGSVKALGVMVDRARAERDQLASEVRRLQEENDVLMEGCRYGVRYLTEAFGAESSITTTLRSVVEAKQAGAT